MLLAAPKFVLPACAQDSFEIEVYGSEALPQDETAVELHSNFNVEAEDNPTPGVYPSQHSLNESVEIAHGFRNWLQGSFYVLSSINTAYGWQWVGDRLRPQIRIPEAWRWPIGLRLSEVGYQRARFSPDTWTLELLPIVDKKIAPWYFAFNPTFDRALHGPRIVKGFEFSPNVKVSYDIFRRAAIGLEYYGSYGPIGSFDQLQQQQHQLVPSLELDLSHKWELDVGYAFGLTPGFIIGSGIFRSPSRVALEAGSARTALLAWVLGGAIALAGSLSLAELGAMFPRAGAVYVFLYEAYGPAIAFLKGWVYLIIGPSAWGALALIFAEYARNFLPLSEMAVHFLAVALIATLAAMGCRSVSLVAWVQTISTWAKITALLGMAVALLFLGRHSPSQVAIAADHWHGLTGLGLALVPVIFAYDGWNGFTAMSGEVRNPGRTIPVSLATGVITVAIVYVVVNLAYFSVLPFGFVQTSNHVAADAVFAIAGRKGTSVIGLLVMLATFSSLNATVITDPRICFAMAETGLFFRSVGRIHPRWGTPYVAIVLNASLACAYVFARSFDQLAEAFVLGVWPFLALAVAAIPVLRWTRPEVPRPYRTTGYPVLPILFVLASIAVMLNALYRHPFSTAISFAILLIGLPVYWTWRKFAADHK